MRCLLCRKEITDNNKYIEETDFCKWYYHKTCWNFSQYATNFNIMKRIINIEKKINKRV